MYGSLSEKLPLYANRSVTHSSSWTGFLLSHPRPKLISELERLGYGLLSDIICSRCVSAEKKDGAHTQSLGRQSVQRSGYRGIGIYKLCVKSLGLVVMLQSCFVRPCTCFPGNQYLNRTA